MANNCYNFITINGNENEIKEFSKLLEISNENQQEDGFDTYQNLVTIFKNGNIGNDGRWFDIYINDQDENSITISGDSAWTPCFELLTAISEKFESFEIRYEYFEPGCDFAGWAEVNQGNCNDNCFGYWEGKVKIDREDALYDAICNELDYYETKEELIESDMYNAFDDEEKAEILETFLLNQ